MVLQKVSRPRRTAHKGLDCDFVVAADCRLFWFLTFCAPCPLGSGEGVYRISICFLFVKATKFENAF